MVMVMVTVNGLCVCLGRRGLSIYSTVPTVFRVTRAGVPGFPALCRSGMLPSVTVSAALRL